MPSSTFSLEHHASLPTSIEKQVVPVFRWLEFMNVKSRYTFRLHQHPTFEVILVDQGVYRCLLNKREIVLRPGDMLVVKPGDWHKDFLVAPLRYFALNFRLAGQPDPVFAESVHPEHQHFHAGRGILWQVIKHLHEECRAGDQIAGHIQDALMSEFFWLLVRHLPREAVQTSLLEASHAGDFVERLQRLFRSQLNQSLSLAEMAQAMSMSASSLAHKCQEALHMPPMHAFLKFKIQQAQIFLGESSMSVKEVGLQVGFEDPYHFSKVFKRHAGVPPSSCR